MTNRAAKKSTATAPVDLNAALDSLGRSINKSVRERNKLRWTVKELLQAARFAVECFERKEAENGNLGVDDEDARNVLAAAITNAEGK